jgi:predicted component of type VI protein secretion system
MNKYNLPICNNDNYENYTNFIYIGKFSRDAHYIRCIFRDGDYKNFGMMIIKSNIK